MLITWIINFNFCCSPPIDFADNSSGRRMPRHISLCYRTSVGESGQYSRLPGKQRSLPIPPYSFQHFEIWLQCFFFDMGTWGSNCFCLRCHVKKNNGAKCQHRYCEITKPQCFLCVAILHLSTIKFKNIHFSIYKNVLHITLRTITKIIYFVPIAQYLFQWHLFRNKIQNTVCQYQCLTAFVIVMSVSTFFR